MHKSITIQPGHVPRKTGSTGTIREQEFTAKLAGYMAPMLRQRGWEVHVVPADPPGRIYPDTDLFIALHCDGSSNPAVNSASFFYPPRDKDSSWSWGMAWSAAHQRIAGYKWGFRRPNYVAAVSSGFYAWRASRVIAGIATPAEVCLLIEHYFATNPEEAEWAWKPGTIRKMAEAHVAALGAWNGHPEGNGQSAINQGEDSMSLYCVETPFVTLMWAADCVARPISPTSAAEFLTGSNGPVEDGQPAFGTPTPIWVTAGQMNALRSTWFDMGMLDERSVKAKEAALWAAAGLDKPKGMSPARGGGTTVVKAPTVKEIVAGMQPSFKKTETRLAALIAKARSITLTGKSQ